MDCLSDIKQFLTFSTADDFYFLQILQRKKENPQLGSNSRVIKNYYITSVEQLERKYPEIITLCKTFNARAMLRLNKRSFEQVAFKCLENVANTMQNKEYLHISKCYDRACGLLTSADTKKWIVDIDSPEVDMDVIKCTINLCAPAGDKILALLPTKNGWHFITTPFNVAEFRQYTAAYITQTIDIHKDNPINLYIP